MALIYPQNGDLTKSLKSARKKVPQSARLSAGGGAKAKRAMPKCPQYEFEECFPNVGNLCFFVRLSNGVVVLVCVGVFLCYSF